MARRFQQRSFGRSTSRANRGWVGIVDAAVTIIPAASKVLVAAFVLDNQGIDETVLRVVGQISVFSDQLVGSEFQTGAVGMCVVTDTAIGLGITALPDPVTDVSDDLWLWYQGISQRFTFLTSAGFDARGATQYSFDNKAKRIVHTGSSLAVVAANASATEGFSVGLNFRMLTQVRGTR